MKFGIDFFALVTLLGVIHGLFLAAAFARLKTTNRAADRFLAAFLTIVSLVNFGSVLNRTGLIFEVPHLAQIHTPFRLLFGPLFYFFCRAVLENDRSVTSADARHGLPFLADVIFLIPFYRLDASAKTAFMASALDAFPTEWTVRTGLLLLQGGCYLPATVWLYRKHKPNAPSHLPTMISVVAGLWGISLLRFLFDFRPSSSYFLPVCFSVCVYAGFWTLLKRTFHQQSELVPATATEYAEVEVPPRRKYEKSALLPERADSLLIRLRTVLETEKPYLDGDFSLGVFAERLAVPPQYLSQVVNQQLGQNFNDFVNSYRVEEAKRRLADPRFARLSILGIAEDAGFNSKSVFNAAFKKHTGVTPSEYRRSVVSPASERNNESSQASERSEMIFSDDTADKIR